MLGFEDQTRTEEVYLAIRRLKRSKCMEQKQAVGINHDILIKMIAAQPDTLSQERATEPCSRSATISWPAGPNSSQFGMTT